jgi:molybdopterin converting factor small subunit
MRVELLLFGPLRPYASAGSIQVELPEGATVGRAREEIAALLERAIPGPSTRTLVARSALATEDEVLSEDAPIPAGTRSLAILPPVCGG